ncbi:TPA: bacteriohemerythrin, partial [Klebsiella pneumoniae]
TETLEVGIAEIDEQHRWLVEQTNDLHDAMQTGASHAQIGALLDGLMDYVMNHFIVEEELFIRLGYPESEAHLAQHNIFTGKILSLLARHESAEGVGPEALELLKNWLIQHILKTDKAYVEHFRNNGDLVGNSLQDVAPARSVNA